ncbi:MAG TPA: chromosomal replication initiator protein DnaA [Mollicutes bacterium]|nr:chromosomal replication initiator protein DnaA [Mollicutes bacterium]
MDKDTIWQNFLNIIRSKLTSLPFDTWFKGTKLYELDNGIAKVIVPMHVHKKHLNDNYIDLIVETFNEVTGTNFEFQFILEEEINVKKKQISNNDNIGVPYNDPIQANLNTKYIFDNFIVGESNFFAHAAAVSVAENPGKAYNPLFIYGNSGLGKTHLMHAIGNYIVKNTNKKVLYVTSEKFVSDFLNLTKRDSNGTNYDYIEYFKDKYRNIDVLIIDDIQMLSGAPASQQEFFHTFNDLYDDNKQIIISSDRSPDDLKLLEERLVTRFNWGLKVNIYPPDYELRINILKKKMINRDLSKTITNDVLEYVANNFQADVRQLEGALTRIYAYATMFNVPKINLDVAIEALKDYLNKSLSLKNDIHRIQKTVAEFYKVRVDDLKSNRRTYEISYPRQVAMYLSRKLTDESFIKIGMEFGGKNHSTVIHACDKIERDIKCNKEIKNMIDNLIQQLK